MKELERTKTPFEFHFTFQHWNLLMAGNFFEEFGLEPHIPSEDGEEMTLGGIKDFIGDNTTCVIVQGDTNSALYGAIAAIGKAPIVHIEAGVRSQDKRMVEEYNRMAIDHISEVLIAPTEIERANLVREGILGSYVFGNTITDAIEMFKPTEKLGKHILLTLHRAETVDNELVFRNVLEGVMSSALELGLPIVFPIHPRTEKRCEEFGINLNDYGIEPIQPVSFKEMLQLENNSDIIITDSGGVVEEACYLHIPTVVVREKTDRPGAEMVGASQTVGSDPELIVEATRHMVDVKRDWKCPYGDGKVAEKIVNLLKTIVWK